MSNPAAAVPLPGPGRLALGLAGWVLLCFGAALVGSFFPPGEWYAQLRKPAWNPPNWIFGPVWTALYTLMAVSAWLVWKDGGFARRRRALSLFGLQLACNALWTPLFFGLRRPDLALVDLALLWVAVVATLVGFWKVRRLAGVLLIPYLAWISFAGLLNWALWRLNA